MVSVNGGGRLPPEPSRDPKIDPDTAASRAYELELKFTRSRMEDDPDSMPNKMSVYFELHGSISINEESGWERVIRRMIAEFQAGNQDANPIVF